MFGPKIPVVAAAVGFVLSFLIGLFSGAAFPVFLLRAVIMALFFAAVAAGVHLLIQRFLPELLDSTGETAGDQGEKTTGSVVDLTVGEQEEDPVLSFGSNDSPPETTEHAAQDADEAAAEPYGSDSLFNEDPDEVSDNSGTVSPVEEKSAAQQGSATVNESTGSEPAPAAGVQSPPGKKPKGAAAGLDVLPDIQDFVPDKTPESDDETDDALAVEPVVHGFSVPDVTTDAVETETMAKAIRTILSKDN